MPQIRPNQKSSQQRGWAYPDGTVSRQKNTDRRPPQKNRQTSYAENGRSGPAARPAYPNAKNKSGVHTPARTKTPGSGAKNISHGLQNGSRAPQGNRTNQGRAKKRPMTVSEIREDRKKRRINPETSEIERKRRRREQFRIKKRRKDMIRVFAGRFVLFLIAFAVIASMSSVAFAYSFFRTEEKNPAWIVYKIGGDSKKEAYSTAVSGGVLRVNFSEAAEYLGFAVTGDTERLNYIITEKTNEYSPGSVKVKEEMRRQAEIDALAQDENSAAAEADGDTAAEDGYEDDAVSSADSEGTGEEEILTIDIDSNKAWINGQEIILGTKSERIGKHLWVDIGILFYINGITVDVDKNKRVVSITKNTVKNDDGTDYKISEDKNVYEFLSLSLKNSYSIENIPEDIFSSPAIEFNADLSAYEEYMNPEDRDAYLLLVNYENYLAQDYVPEDLTGVKNTRDDGRDIQKMREYPAKALEAMFLEMNANNIWNVSVTSGYRSYEYQSVLFNQKVAEYSHLGEEEAKIKAATIVAIPGTSEHQSGLCCDMHNLAAADVSFADTGAYEWMKENAHKFGFIVRFPEDKTDITKISFEPWHYRYVGRYHASRMYELNMCLEEYLEYLKN